MKKIIFLLGGGLHNGQWHSVSLSAKRNRVILVVDNDTTSAAHASLPIHIFSGDTYYFGGKMHFFLFKKTTTNLVVSNVIFL